LDEDGFTAELAETKAQVKNLKFFSLFLGKNDLELA